MAAAVETTSLPPAPPARPSVAQRDPAPNLVEYSAGAVCCPDEKSARTARTRATWVDRVPIRDLSMRGRPIIAWFPPKRRWTS